MFPFAFLFSNRNCPQLFLCVTGVGVSCLVMSHVLAFADILFKALLFPFLIGLWFDVWLLFNFAQVFIRFFSFIFGIRSYAWITVSQLLFPYLLGIVPESTHRSGLGKYPSLQCIRYSLRSEHYIPASAGHFSGNLSYE